MSIGYYVLRRCLGGTTMQTYYEKHREELKKRNWEYIQNNRDKHREYMRRHVKKHKDKFNEKNKELRKEKYESDNQFKIKAVQMARHTQFLNGQCSTFANVVAMPLYEYRQHIESMLDKDLNWDNYGKKWRIGRKKPAKDFNLENPDELLQFFSVDNIIINQLYTD